MKTPTSKDEEEQGGEIANEGGEVTEQNEEGEIEEKGENQEVQPAPKRDGRIYILIIIFKIILIKL